MKRQDKTIIIIGAGASGLMAAKRLAKRYKIILLEASDRVGGRIHTEKVPGFSRPIEAGAEFIHGKLPVTLKLLKKGNIDYKELKGKFYRADERGFCEQQEMIEGWDKVLKQMKKEKHDMTLHEFLQKHYSGDEYSGLRQHIRNYAEGFDVADTAKASMKVLYNEWSNEDHEIYRVSGGYGQLITYLFDECKKNDAEFFMNSIVTVINWEKNKVSVQTKDGQQYNGEKCIVTVPIHFLQQTNTNSINFNPWLQDHISAASEIGYSTVLKVVLEFNEPFWNSYAKNTGFIITDQQIPTWWTQLPDTIPLLTGWKGGPGAADLSIKSDEEILQIALQSLSSIFKMSVPELQEKIIASKVFNWIAQEFAQGAYSYAYPSSKEAKRILNGAVDETIFFAGEALYDKESSGTVEAALITGKEVATKLKRADLGIKKIGARIEIQPRF